MPETTILQVDGLRVELEYKHVRNINLRIRRDGTLHVSLPFYMEKDAAIDFVRRKRSWIDQHLARMGQPNPPTDDRPAGETPFPADGTIFPLWGKKLPLRTVPGTTAPTVTATEDALVLTCRAMDSDKLKKQALQRFYVAELKAAMKRIALDCQIECRCYAMQWRMKFMTSRWGSCNIQTQVISVNVLLAGYPEGCLHTVLVHELCHLQVAAHNAAFYAAMDAAWPAWRIWDPLLKQQYPSLRYLAEKG